MKSLLVIIEMPFWCLIYFACTVRGKLPGNCNGAANEAVDHFRNRWGKDVETISQELDKNKVV